MKLASVKVYKYTLPLRRCLVIGNTALNERTGLLVKVQSDDGYLTIAEASPLPGLSQEDVSIAAKQLMKWASYIVGCKVPDSATVLCGNPTIYEQGECLGASVVFCMEASMLGLEAAAKGLSIQDLISPSPLESVRVNALLSGSSDMVLERASQLLHEGYTAFKLKVGRNEIRQDIEMVRRVRALIGRENVLRLDANCAWTIDQARSFAFDVAELNIDYIEEPVQCLSDLISLVTSTCSLPIPIALDQSLLGVSTKVLSALLPKVKALVLKPTLLGMSKTLKLCRAANSHGVSPVISSAFESGVGITILARLAASVQGHYVPAGLDTLEWFDSDLLIDNITVQRGCISMGSLSSPVGKLNEKFLKEIGSVQDSVSTS